jgi:hypothetical protein
MVSRDIVRRFFIQKLAHIISQNSEKVIPLSPEESSRLDWLIAENYIDYFPGIISGAVQTLNDKNLEWGYENFEREYGQYIWDYCYQRLSRSLRNHTYVYKNVTW